MARTSASAASRSARVGLRRSTSSVADSRRPRWAACRRAMTPTLQVTPGQRPLSAWSAMTLWAAARMALRPFSGSTPAWAARPWTVRRRSTVPLRALTMSPLARAHSSTKATSDSSAAARTSGVLLGEPISSSGLAMKTRRLKGSHVAGIAARSRAARRGRGGRPAGRPSCRSRPGRRRGRPSMRNGRAAAVPGSKTVSMWPMSSARGPPGATLEGGHDRVAQAPGRVRTTFDPRAEVSQGGRRPAGDLVDAVPGVGAAVDVHERRQVVEVARQAGARRRARRRSISASVTGAAAVGCGHRRAVYGRSGDLYSADRAPHRDPAPRWPQPLPPGADRQDRGRRRAPADLVRAAPAGRPRRRRARAPGPRARRAAARRATWRPGSGACTA